MGGASSLGRASRLTQPITGTVRQKARAFENISIQSLANNANASMQSTPSLGRASRLPTPHSSPQPNSVTSKVQQYKSLTQTVTDAGIKGKVEAPAKSLTQTVKEAGITGKKKIPPPVPPKPKLPSKFAKARDTMALRDRKQAAKALKEQQTQEAKAETSKQPIKTDQPKLKGILKDPNAPKSPKAIRPKVSFDSNPPVDITQSSTQSNTDADKSTKTRKPK